MHQSNQAEQIINPMKAGTARLAVAGNEIALLHAINTPPDWNIGGIRHQKALSTRLNATTGSRGNAHLIGLGRPFPRGRRLLTDGTKIIELHLGDAYPPRSAPGRTRCAGPIHCLESKGVIGSNDTHTANWYAGLDRTRPDLRLSGAVCD
jgi:hypothetical protein